MGEIINSAANLAFSPYETLMDSTGLTRHGRDMVHQESMAHEQMAWQSNENQLNRDFSKAMYEQQVADYMKNSPLLMQQQADIQFNQWKNQQAYNSPANMAARSLAGGFNPAANSAQLVQGSSANPAIAPPPQIHGSPLGGTASPIGIPQGMSSELMRDFGGLVKDLSQSRLNERTLGKIDAEVDKLLSEKELNDSLKAYQDITNGIKQVFGYKRESLELIKIIKESYKAESEGNYAEAAALQQKALARLNNSNASINEAKVPFVAKLMEAEIKRTQAQTREANARAFEASETGKIQVSIGSYYKAMADTENALRDGRVTAQELANDLSTIQKYIQGNELKFSDATLENRINMVFQGLLNQELINRQQFEKWEQMKFDTQTMENTKRTGFFVSVIGAIAQLLGAFGGVYNGSLNRMSAKERNEIQSQFNDILDRHYTPVKPSEVRGFGYTPAWQE